MTKLSCVIAQLIKTPNCNLYQFWLRRPRFNSCDVLCKCHSVQLTHEQFILKSEKYAKALYGAGIRKGNIVPIFSEPSVDAVIVFFALNRLGAISTFLNNTASIDEVVHYSNNYEANVLLLSESCMEQIDKNMLIKSSTIQKIVLISSVSNKKTQEAILLSDLAEAYADAQVELDEAKKSAPAHISYTSGSTGLPKAILLSNENIMAEIISLLRATKMQLGPKKNLMQVVPFNYPYGFIVSTLLPIFAGRTVALSPGLTLQNIGEYLKMYRPCYINGIPSFYKAMMSDPAIKDMDLSYIQYPVTGGDTLERKTEHDINQFFQLHGSKGRIANGCGNGEGCGSLLNPSSVIYKYVTGSCGRPIPGLSVKLIDDATGNPVPIGESGRFCFAGTNVMMEYYNDPTATDQAIHYDADGRRWFYTDTFMHMDKRHWMFMDGRERRFFITFDEMGSPYKVYCDYVQQVIADLSPMILCCAVVKKEDKTRGFVPFAFVELADSVTDEKQFFADLRQKCRQKLQRCAIPIAFIAIEKLPLTVAGKIDYRALEREAQNG